MKEGAGKGWGFAQRGQALVLIALSFIGLLAIVGLAVDGGQLFIGVDNLRRATDSAALDAANQIRNTPGVSTAQLQHSAAQAINLNGINPTGVTVDTCATAPGDPELCKLFPGTTIYRKLVRVTAQASVQMSFLTIVGIPSVTISANSVAEAASLDVVLAIDISESMTYDAPHGDPNRDPNVCNPTNVCQPFAKVKAAATSFANQILWSANPADNSDRVAVVYFSHGWTEGPPRTGGSWKGTDVLAMSASGWTNDQSNVDTFISGLRVYNPPRCDDPIKMPPGTAGPCRNYDMAGNYVGFDCPLFRATGDVSSCTTTNTGGALRLAGNMFSSTPRKDAVWIVVLLTDGASDASDMHNPFFPYGYCPGTPGNPDWMPPFCRDNNNATRHSTASANYDAEDYAMDMADYVACAPVNPDPGCGAAGQGAVIFTIGLGNQVLTPTDPGGTPFGAYMLRYVADVGYEGIPNDPNDPCVGVGSYSTSCGNYFYAPTGAQLQAIFNVIASRIFTRLTH